LAKKQRKLPGIREPRAASEWEKQLYYYDLETEQNWLEVFPLFFKYIEGDEYGQEFQLLDFWLKIFLRFFCWKDKVTKCRRYRELYIFIPRKNGKTLTLAAVGLAMMMIERIHRGQIYIIASDEKQAGVMFEMQVAMIEASEDLQERFFAASDHIVHVETGAEIRILSSRKKGKTGLKPHFVIIDEYQEQPDDDAEMVMETGAIANKEPILAKIGTMGAEDETEKRPWQAALDRGREVVKDPKLEPTLLPVIFECTQDDDPGDPELWRRVNPGLGITIDEISFKALWDKAKEDPAKRQKFCQYNLNMPVSVTSEYIDIVQYKTLFENYDMNLFAGKHCFGGLDIGVTDDMFAFTLLYPEWREIEVKNDETGEPEKIMHPLIRMLPFYFCPTIAIKKSEKRAFSYVPYVKSGQIIECGSTAVNFTDATRKIKKICKETRFQELGFDPYYSGAVIQTLIKAKIECVKVYQSFRVLSFPTTRFRDDVNEGDFLHNGNDVFLWNLKNCRIVSDDEDHIKLSKKHKAGKIDGVAAGINAYRVFMDAPPPKPRLEIFSF
jgi:phage terminase large subunit-like protein